MKVSEYKKQEDQHAQPPPPTVLTPDFPMDPALVNDLDQFHHKSKDRHLDVPDPHSCPNNHVLPIDYISYIFTKHPVDNKRPKETWAIVDRALLRSSQADLKNQVDKGITGLDQYMHLNMYDFKRMQISGLIRECIAMDPKFEYSIASIKHSTRRKQSGLDTTAMQVILKRQLRPDVDAQGPIKTSRSLQQPSIEIIDLKVMVYHYDQTRIDTQGPFMSSDCLHLPRTAINDLPSMEYHYNQTCDASSLSSGRSERNFPSEMYSSNTCVHEHLYPQRADPGDSQRLTTAPTVPSSHDLDTELDLRKMWINLSLTKKPRQ